jgi:predicted NBD/HSP70 family sugar kinase
VNVDYLAACVVDLTGAVRGTVIRHGDQRGRAVPEVLADLAALAREATAAPGLTVAGAALAVPGLVEAPHGRIRRAPNLAWQDLEIGPELRRLLPAAPFEPVVGNEADFAALAEAHADSAAQAGERGADAEARAATDSAAQAGQRGANAEARAVTASASQAGERGADAKARVAAASTSVGGRSKQSAQKANTRGAESPLTDFLYVSGEIGVGAGIILDREPFRGARGWAGEIGHVTVEPEGASCRCGARGCLETVAGLEALRRTGPEAAAPALGRAVAAAVNLLDLPAVVLGGVYARPEFAALIPGVERALSEHVIFSPWAPITVRVSRLGTAAAAAGAGTAVIRRVHSDPAAWMSAC